MRAENIYPNEAQANLLTACENVLPHPHWIVENIPHYPTAGWRAWHVRQYY